MTKSTPQLLSLISACALLHCAAGSLMGQAGEFAGHLEAGELELNPSPEGRTATWPDQGQENRLAPKCTIIINIKVEETGNVGGVDYQLKGAPNITGLVENEFNLWDGEPAAETSYMLTNTAVDSTRATLTVSCIWEPVPYGSGGSGPRPGDIAGHGEATVYLEDSVVSWEFDREIAIYDLADHDPDDRRIYFTVNFTDTADRKLSSDQISQIEFGIAEDPPALQGAGLQAMAPSNPLRIFGQLTENIQEFTNWARGYYEAQNPQEGGSGEPVAKFNDGTPEETEPEPPLTFGPLEIVNAAKEPTATLEIAKMEHSLKADGSLIIDDDEDRFYVRIRNAGHLGAGTVKVSTVDNPVPAYNNPQVSLTLQTEEAHLITPSMILVSDQVDDEYPGLNGEVGANNEDGDRSYLIQLGGSVLVSEAEIGAEVQPLETRATVEVEDTVHLNVVVFNGSGTTVQAIQDEIDGRVRERFAQIGIEVTREVNAADWNTPLWGTPVGFHVRRVGDDGLYVPDQVLNLINHFTKNVHPNTITAFVVLEIHAFDEDEVSRPRGGVAFHRSITWDYLDEQFRNCFFVEGSARPWIFAHELGHMTTDKVHYGETYPDPKPPQHRIDHNLMKVIINTTNVTVRAPKRLYRLQKGNNHHQEAPE